MPVKKRQKITQSPQTPTSSEPSNGDDAAMVMVIEEQTEISQLLRSVAEQLATLQRASKSTGEALLAITSRMDALQGVVPINRPEIGRPMRWFDENLPVKSLMFKNVTPL